MTCCFSWRFFGGNAGRGSGSRNTRRMVYQGSAVQGLSVCVLVVLLDDPEVFFPQEGFGGQAMPVQSQRWFCLRSEKNLPLMKRSQRTNRSFRVRQCSIAPPRYRQPHKAQHRPELLAHLFYFALLNHQRAQTRRLLLRHSVEVDDRANALVSRTQRHSKKVRRGHADINSPPATWGVKHKILTSPWCIAWNASLIWGRSNL
jgi:hypothetical protein